MISRCRQKYGEDYKDTFAPSREDDNSSHTASCSRHPELAQPSNTLLHGKLLEDVYMKMPWIYTLGMPD